VRRDKGRGMRDEGSGMSEKKKITYYTIKRI